MKRRVLPVVLLSLVTGVFSYSAAEMGDDGPRIPCSYSSDQCSRGEAIEACKQYAWANSKCSQDTIIRNCSEVGLALREERGECFGEVFFNFSKSNATSCSDRPY